MVKERESIINNKEFLIWLKDAINDGYVPHLSILEINNLINKIVSWYQFKFPNKTFELEHGVKDRRFDSDYSELREKMDLDAFRYTLSFDEIAALDCNYREPNMNASFSSFGHFDKDGNYYESRAWYEYVSLMTTEVIEKDLLVSRFVISANAVNGIVDNYALNKLSHYFDEVPKTVTLDELYEKVKGQDMLDLSELEFTVKFHKYDIRLRRWIIDMAIYAIINSNDTILEFGKKRAIEMAMEFNKYYNIDIDVNNLNINNKSSKEKNRFILRRKINSKLK